MKISANDIATARKYLTAHVERHERVDAEVARAYEALGGTYGVLRFAADSSKAEREGCESGLPIQEHP